MARCAVLILAGGSGSRVGSDIPKQYLNLGGVPVIRRTVEVSSLTPQLSSYRSSSVQRTANAAARRWPGWDFPPLSPAARHGRTPGCAASKLLKLPNPTTSLFTTPPARSSITGPSTAWSGPLNRLPPFCRLSRLQIRLNAAPDRQPSSQPRSTDRICGGHRRPRVSVSPKSCLHTGPRQVLN